VIARLTTLVMALIGLTVCRRQSATPDDARAWFAGICRDLDRAPDDHRPTGPVTVGEYRFGQALMWHCPLAAADAIADGLWRERHAPESERFRFWHRMGSYPIDSVVFNQALRIVRDASAPALARAAGYQLASRMSTQASDPGRSFSDHGALPDLRAVCMNPRVDTIYRVSHGGRQVIRPLPAEHARRIGVARAAVGAAADTPVELRRWLGFC
jgi:hypothetical protein